MQGESKREMALVMVTYEPERYLSAMVIAMPGPGKIVAAIRLTVASVAVVEHDDRAGKVIDRQVGAKTSHTCR